MTTAGPERERHQPESHRRVYLRTLLWLAVLMGLKVAVVSAVMPRALTVGTLLVLMALKIYLIAAFFMHLRFERATLVYVALTPVILLIVLFFGVAPDFGAVFGR